LGTLGGIVGGLVSACSSPQSSKLWVEVLEGSLPPQVLKAFRQQLQPGSQIFFEGADQLAEIFQQLQQWQPQPPAPRPLWQRWLRLPAASSSVEGLVPDLVTLGDYWLSAAVRQGLLQPLLVNELKQWSQLAPRWRDWVTRNRQGELDRQGQVWGAPYRVQGLMLAYQKSIFKQRQWQPMQWSDLWRPELKGRIAVPHHPRLVLSLVLKVLGYSVNDEGAMAKPEVQDQLQALYRQVRTFDSETSLKALINEDVWLAVGWSGDISAALSRYQTLRASFLKTGRF
jgi:putative spermidine/putrescine transport system substrate-binding protein